MDTPWVQAYRGSCQDVLPLFDPQTVDMVLTDPPFGTTQQPFDIPIDMDWMMPELFRVAKKNSCIAMFAMQPFATRVICAAWDDFRYELIMEKTHAQGFMNCKKMPMKAHENVLIFYKSQPTYNPQMETGKPYKVEYTRNYDQSNYGKKECGRKGKILVNTGTRYPRSVMRVSNPNMKMLHPHGKSVDYLRWLIRTYTNEWDIILDATAGAFSTPVAAVLENRNCIVIEQSLHWFDFGCSRLKDETGIIPEVIRL